MVGYSQGTEGGLSWQAVDEAPPSSGLAFDRTPDEPSARRETVSESLAKVIEAEIIPRLMLAHSMPMREPVAVEADEGDQVEAFTALVRSDDMKAISAYVSAKRAGGMSVEAIFLNLLAPTARHLGELWTADIVDFVDVTVALSRLQHVMTELGPDFVGETASRASDRRILLLPTPGEQHTFGLGMVEKFFRRSGWDVAGGGNGPGAEYDRLLRRETFSVVGLSLSSTIKMGSLVSTIRTIRKVSRNKSVCIMVGGPVFVDRPELGVLVGADATAANGPAAVLVAQSLLDMRARAC